MALVACLKCNTSHRRPVGKKCTYVIPTPSVIASVPPVATADSQMLTILQSIQASMGNIESRVTNLETEVPDSLITQPSGDEELHLLPIPTLQTLKSTDSIQRDVQARLATITAGVSTGSDSMIDSVKVIKSGRNRGPETSAKHYVVWPHELVYVGAERNTAQYDTLSPVQFITGFLRSLQLAPTTDRDNILAYGIDLFQDAVDVNWEVARGANAVILQEIEQGRLTWSDSDKLQRTRALYTQRAQVSRAAASSVPNYTHNKSENAVSGGRKTICRYFNTDKCAQGSDHKVKGTLYRHICSYCFKTYKKSVGHPETKCGAKNNTTN